MPNPRQKPSSRRVLLGRLYRIGLPEDGAYSLVDWTVTDARAFKIDQETDLLVKNVKNPPCLAIGESNNVSFSTTGADNWLNVDDNLTVFRDKPTRSDLKRSDRCAAE